MIEEKGAAGEWDVVDVEAAELLRGASDGLYEEIDYSQIDETVLLESAVHPYGVGLMTYSIVLGYDPDDRSEDGEAPVGRSSGRFKQVSWAECQSFGHLSRLQSAKCRSFHRLEA